MVKGEGGLLPPPPASLKTKQPHSFQHVFTFEPLNFRSVKHFSKWIQTS